MKKKIIFYKLLSILLILFFVNGLSLVRSNFGAALSKDINTCYGQSIKEAQQYVPGINASAKIYQESSYTKATNHFQEGGCLPSPTKNWPQVNALKLASDLKSKNVDANNLPPVVDLSDGLPPVKSQGNQGSCVGWAVGYYYKTFQEGKEHKWDLTKQAHQFSPAFIYNQLNEGIDFGINIADALKLLVNKGCATLAAFPYDEKDYLTQPNSEQLDLAKSFKIQSFYNFFQGAGNCTDETINIMKQWIANGDAIVFSLKSFNSFKFAPNDPEYVAPSPGPSEQPCPSHAILAVGYNDNVYYIDNNGAKHYGAFKFVNSKGTDYGYKGFVYVSYDYIKTAADEAWCMSDAPDPTDFTIGLTPARQQVMVGNAITYSLTLSSLGGFKGDVSIFVSGLPDGISASLAKNQVFLNSEEKIDILISTNSSVVPNKYDFVVSAKSGNILHKIYGIIEVVPVKGLLIHVKNQYGEPANDLYSNYSVVANANSSGNLYLGDLPPGSWYFAVYSMDDYFGISKNLTVPGEYTFDTTELCPVRLEAKRVDGTILNAFFQISSAESTMIFPPGSDKVLISPGIYSIVAYSDVDHYYLAKRGVELNSKEEIKEIILDASLMDTGSLTVTYDKKFNLVGILIKSENIFLPHWFNWINEAYWVSGQQKFSETNFIVSCGNYEVSYYLDIWNKEVPEEHTYRFNGSNIQVFKGATTKVDLGKEVTSSIEVPKAVYPPGSTINIKVVFGDGLGGFLNEVLYAYKLGVLENNLPIGKTYFLYPQLTIKDQESNIVFDKTLESFYDLKDSGFNFVVPSDWKEGDYTITVSLDTGPLSGLVTSSYIIKVLKSCTINSSSTPGGTILPSGAVTVNYGNSQTFTITPNIGYKIKDVKIDGASIGAVSTYTFNGVLSDHTIEASFEAITFTITASAGSGGSISSSGTVTVNYGDSKIFTITPDKGYKIKDVKVDGKSVGAVSTYTFSNITDNHTIEATFEKNEIVIVLQVGQTTFTVNGTPNTLDSPPVIKNNRTLLPIRPIVEALGGTVGWDGNERKVTISLGSTTIELWIGKNTARVNGTNTPIDSTNSKVVPEIINGRTMLPLRFVTENLGCQLQWDPNTKTITITYQGV
jgi:C1A family cysteine protease